MGVAALTVGSGKASRLKSSLMNRQPFQRWVEVLPLRVPAGSTKTAQDMTTSYRWNSTKLPATPHDPGLVGPAAAVAAGLGDGFTGHAARAGMAVDLVGDGAELSAVMVAGRWKSAAMVSRYAQGTAAGRGAVARYHGQRGG